MFDETFNQHTDKFVMKESELLNNIRVICDPDKKGQQETAKEVFLNSG